MFESTSRYTKCDDAKLVADDGRIIFYKRRRFLPAADKMSTLQEITTKAGDRLDTISFQTLGYSEQFWRICDANNIMHPLELTETPNKTVRIAVPWG